MSTPESVHPFTPLLKFAQFSGRSRRQEYWLWVLVNFALGCVLGLVSPVLEVVWMFVALIPGWAVFCRRMHDTGRSGWNWLWYLLPLIGWIIVLIYLCQDSVIGHNQYGPNPKGIGNE